MIKQFSIAQLLRFGRKTSIGNDSALDDQVYKVVDTKSGEEVFGRIVDGIYTAPSFITSETILVSDADNPDFEENEPLIKNTASPWELLRGSFKRL